jgi:glycosyltransferase involved in cell wall biosynthesis
MHFALVIYGSLDTLSGGYLYDRQLVAHLRAAGHTVEIISRSWRNYARHLADNANGGWARQLHHLRCDVLLQDELNHPSLVWVNRRLRRTTPIVSLVHHLRCDEQHPRLLRWFYRMIERAYLRAVSGFIFNSHTTRRAAQTLAGATPPHVVAWPAGDRFADLPSHTAIAARATAPGPLRVISVGNVIPRKGLHTLLAGLGQLPLAQWHLTVVGRLDADRAYAQRMQAQAAALPNVVWRGALSEADLYTALNTSDVLAVPSTYEGFGIVYLEGMAFGLPALATTAGAAREIITPHINGWLIPPDDAAALAAALRPLLTDRESLIQTSLAARQRYDQHPTWEQSLTRARHFLETWS